MLRLTQNHEKNRESAYMCPVISKRNVLKGCGAQCRKSPKDLKGSPPPARDVVSLLLIWRFKYSAVNFYSRRRLRYSILNSRLKYFRARGHAFLDLVLKSYRKHLFSGHVKSCIISASHNVENVVFFFVCLWICFSLHALKDILWFRGDLAQAWSIHWRWIDWIIIIIIFW